MLFKQTIESTKTIGLITKYKATFRRVLILVDLLETNFVQKCILHFVIRLTAPNRKIRQINHLY